MTALLHGFPPEDPRPPSWPTRVAVHTREALLRKVHDVLTAERDVIEVCSPEVVDQAVLTGAVERSEMRLGVTDGRDPGLEERALGSGHDLR